MAFITPLQLVISAFLKPLRNSVNVSTFLASQNTLFLVRNCLTCLQLKRLPNNFLTQPLQELSSLQSFPGDKLQIDLIGPFQSPSYRYVLTGIDVFTKYLFPVPFTSPSAEASALVNIFFRHSYLPETILTDLGTNFTPRLFHEFAVLLEIRRNDATLKHPVYWRR